MLARLRCRSRVGLLSTAALISNVFIGSVSIAQESGSNGYRPDPMAPNNGMYPHPSEYDGHYFNMANLYYPKEQTGSVWPLDGELNGELTQENAEKYAEKILEIIEPDMRVLVENHQAWNARERGWYNMVWRGGGVPGVPISGREVIMNTNLGQIVPNTSWKMDYRPVPLWTQNYGVIYYNDTAAYTLGQVFEDPDNPQPEKARFEDGSIVVKIEASTVQPIDWPYRSRGVGASVLGGAAAWNVYRPTTENQKEYQRDPNDPKIVELTNVVQTVYPFQLAIKVKDTIASPDTGWVYLGYVYDSSSDGEGAWDRFVPAGLMWGNDPDFALGEPPFDDDLTETWINRDAPEFVVDTLGWAGRFAAPMDVAVRHNVTFLLPLGSEVEDPPEDGFRASSCLSCHGAAQTPYTDSIYPSPSNQFPPDGDIYPLYWPGTEDWARWFQNRPGDVPMAEDGTTVALDYDLSSMLALMIANRNDTFGEPFLGSFNAH